MEVKTQLTEKARRDLVLINKALNEGDQKAYAELLRLYRDAIYFLMLKMSNNHLDAEDLTIEAFGKAFKNLGQYTADFAFSTWLYRIASNNCIDFLRKHKRIPSASEMNWTTDKQDEMLDDLDSGTIDPEENMMRLQKNKHLHQVVDKLKPHYKNLISLRYFNEYSYEEICQKLNLPMGTVKAQLFRARALLLLIMENSREQH